MVVAVFFVVGKEFAASDGFQVMMPRINPRDLVKMGAFAVLLCQKAPVRVLPEVWHNKEGHFIKERWRWST